MKNKKLFVSYLTIMNVIRAYDWRISVFDHCGAAKTINISYHSRQSASNSKLFAEYGLFNQSSL